MQCSHCGTKSDLLKNGKNKAGIQYYLCRSCNTKRCKKWRNTGDNMAFVYKSNRKFQKKNPLKFRAWKIASKLPKKPCEVCKSTKRIHKHHDDYAFPLNVRFLCPLHHKQRHTELLRGVHK